MHARLDSLSLKGGSIVINVFECCLWRGYTVLDNESDNDLGRPSGAPM
jgi:hypothetical protein